MALRGTGAVECLLLLFQLTATVAQNFVVPKVTIEVIKPRGFRASIPDLPNLSLFVIQGHVNKANNVQVPFKGETLQPTDGRWVFENKDIKLESGDIISYYVYVSVNGIGYNKDRLSVYTVDDDKNQDQDRILGNSGGTDCKPTKTKVRGGKACAGQAIFEDHFDTLREDLWQIEQYIPLSHPEYPFVSYQRLPSDPVVTVSNGFLEISPKMQERLPGFTNESIYSGSLDLFSGCTSRAEECIWHANGAEILPPIVSGRVTSASFAFTYGTVFIRAKLPQGDWLYPELLLEPFLNKYGSSNYASGVIRIAAARGNMLYRTLPPRPQEQGNSVLYGGPIMDFDCRNKFIKKKSSPSGWWGDDFHVYSVEWTPDYISLLVDGEEWGRVEAGASLSSQIPQTCTRVPRALLAKGSKMAPFDEFFFLTLGVSAGGITEFDDLTYSTSGQKPWHNWARKGVLNFWESLGAWEPTWTSPKLIVDYVKVVALS